MKKIILIIFCFLLMGCSSEEFQGIISKSCNKLEHGVDTNIVIKSYDGKVNTITITEKYENISSILDSKKSEQNLYSQLNGITLDIENNTFIYNIDVNNTTDLIKERFNIYNEQYKQIKYYEDNGFTCK